MGGSLCVCPVIYRKPPNISPGLILVRKPFLGGLYSGGGLIFGGLIFGGVFCLSDLSPLKLIKGKHSHRHNESNKKIVFKYT